MNVLNSSSKKNKSSSSSVSVRTSGKAATSTGCVGVGGVAVVGGTGAGEGEATVEATTEEAVSTSSSSLLSSASTSAAAAAARAGAATSVSLEGSGGGGGGAEGEAGGASGVGGGNSSYSGLTVVTKEKEKSSPAKTTAAIIAAKTRKTLTTIKRQSTKRLKMNVLQKADNNISSSASSPTPGSTSESQHHYNNNININNTNIPSCSISVSSSSNVSTAPGTPTHYSQHHPPPPAPPLTPAGSSTCSSSSHSSGHKNSLKGTKLARRARSFKDDLVEKFSLMRTANNTLGRSHSPHSPRNKHASSKAPPSAEEVARSSQTLETHVKDISNALKHFRDVIFKKKLEILPGNGTVILETIASMYSVIQSYTLNEQSTVLLSATQQVYQSLAKLIKLCDEVMLSGESDECATLSDANVNEVVDLLEEAVKNLVALAQQKLKERDDCMFRYGGGGGIGSVAMCGGGIMMPASGVQYTHLMRPPVEVAGQRTSLPDITLTPKERDILEKTNSNPIRASHSTESILRDTDPPPKPPLPNRTNNPPPLPPKRRSQQQQTQPSQQFINNISINSDLDVSSDYSLMNYVDHLSVRSRSPDENSSQCSLDSALNHSREEEELKLLRSESRLDDNLMAEDDVDKMFTINKMLTTENKTSSDALDATIPSQLQQQQRQKQQQQQQQQPIPNKRDVNNAIAIANVKVKALGSGGKKSGLACVFAAGIQNVAATASTVVVGATAVSTKAGGGAAIATSTSTSSMAATTISTGATTTTTTSTTANTNNDDNDDVIAITSGAGVGGGGGGDNTEMRIAAAATNNRHSNESGFVSMKSFRTSTQSVSKRSSDYSFQSSTKSSSSNSEIAFGLSQETTGTGSGGGGGAVATTTASGATSAVASSSSSTITTIGGITNNELHYQLQQQQQTATGSSSSWSTFFTSSSSSSIALASTTTSSSLTSEAASQEIQQLQQQQLQLQQQQQQLQQQQQQQLQSVSPDLMVSGGGSSGVSSGVVPPALPPKTLRQSRHSQYDNSDELPQTTDDNVGDLPEMRNQLVNQQQQQIFQWQSKHQSLIEPRSAINLAGSCTAMDRQLDEPPPLPMKKKHILAYMEICSASTRSIQEHRHTMHTYSRNITHSQTMNIVPLTKEISPERETPPALPPKVYKPRKPTIMPPTIITTPPPSPKTTHLSAESYTEIPPSPRRELMMSTLCEEPSMDTLSDTEGGDATEAAVVVVSVGDSDTHFHHSHKLPNETNTSSNNGNGTTTTGGVGDISPSSATTPSGKSPTKRDTSASASSNNESTPICTPEIVNAGDEGGGDSSDKVAVIKNNGYHKKDALELPNMLEEIDITPYLILKKNVEDGPEIKGGYIDALIVHASRVQKVSDNAFSEAFITTFRTFIQPIDVIEKLTHRYTVFFCQMNDQKQKAAKETFSLLVRVVNDLTSTDLTSQLLTLLVEFVFQLVCSGQLYLAKLLRNKFVEKVTLFRDPKIPTNPTDLFGTVTNQPSLLDLKSLEIAEQMTLLDAELFQKIEIPEVLLFAKEQCEEKSPNLNKFTEHFNKMSYWARSKILMLTDAKEREKHVIKFIKIMKHLRKMNNYNSYLALLSALDSAPIRRLEWHKTITEGLKEYCTLIDSSSSFRVYRQALAETNPPCIPYIGLVLQDLTFVHVGNQDYLTKGVINFSKRWQQYNIIVNMKRFKKCSYPFRRNERIIRFFENFEIFLGEEEMWQISETIKPRGKRPTNNY